MMSLRQRSGFRRQDFRRQGSAIRGQLPRATNGASYSRAGLFATAPVGRPSGPSLPQKELLSRRHEFGVAAAKFFEVLAPGEDVLWRFRRVFRKVFGARDQVIDDRRLGFVRREILGAVKLHEPILK